MLITTAFTNIEDLEDMMSGNEEDVSDELH